MRWAQPQLPQPPRRGMALPAIPIAIKAVMVMGKYLRPIGWAARPAAMYAARWWPYYMVKFTVIKQIEAYGAVRVYKHVLWATQRLISGKEERRRVRGIVKAILRLPANVESEVMSKLVNIDTFLLKWALESEGVEIGRYRGGDAAASEWGSVEAQLKQAARQVHSASCVMHTMGPDMVPTSVPATPYLPALSGLCSEQCCGGAGWLGCRST